MRRSLVAAAVVACFSVEVGYGNPTGPTVVNGQVTFAQTGGVLSVTNSPSSIINWQQFSIGRGEITRFIQQSAASAVLNRVVGVDPSSILGSLQSNGRVFLINPNGIVFGAGGRIDTAGLVASTLNMSNEDFLGGRLRFTGDPAKAAAVVNQGRITASDSGRVFLVGAAVDNQGVITAPNGDVVLAAGNSVRVTEGAGSPLQVEITAPADRALNLSDIAYGASGIYAGLVRNRGVINADAVVRGADGRILLKSSGDATLAAGSRTTANGANGGTISVLAGGITDVSGTVEAKGARGSGGRVEVLGDYTGIFDGARIDASGATGGGTILVGGDYQGSAIFSGGIGLSNSRRTFVGRDTELRADALNAGDGGKVVLWAEGDTRFYGTISARGGASGGNGGFAEISGKVSLDARGKVDLSAPRGDYGTVLYDPADIVITGGTADGSDTPDILNNRVNNGTNGQVLFANVGTADPFIVFESEIEGSNANVVLQARNNITTAGVFTAGVTLANNRNLTLNTRNDAGAGDLAGQINLGGIAFQTAGSGTLTINAGTVGTAGATVSTGNLTTANRAISITSAGAISLGGTITGGTGTVTLSSPGAISQAGAIVSTSNLIKNGSGTLTLSQANTYTGTTTVNAGTVAVSANNALGTNAGGTTVAAGATLDLRNVTYSTTEAVTVNGGTLATSTGTSSHAGTVALGANSIVNVGGTQLTLSGVLSGAGFGINKQGSGTLILSGANTYTGTTTVSAGSLSVNSIASVGGGASALGAPTTVANGTIALGAATLQYTGTGHTSNRVINLTGAGTVDASGTGTLTLTGGITGAARNLTLTGTGAGTESGVIGTTTGSLTKTGAGTWTLSGANTYTGTTTVSAGTLAYGASNVINTGAVTVDGATAVLALGNNRSDTVGTVTVANGGSITGTGTSALTSTGSFAMLDGSVSAILAGAGIALNKTTGGTVTLSGANIYTGTTAINAGILRLGAANRIADASAVTVASGSTFDLNNFAETVGSLAGAGNVTLGSAILTAGGDNTSTTFSGVISGTGGLTKAGTGAMTLSGANTYTGATTVSAGTLIAANDAALGGTAGGTTVSSGATLNINNVAIGNETITLSGNGIGGVGALTATGAASLSGALTLSGASRIGTTSGASALTLSGAVNAAGNALDITGAGNLTATNSLNDFGTVTINGTGNISLVDANALTIGTSSVGTLSAQTLSGDLALGGDVTATGSGDTIVLAAAANFDNTGGFSLNPGASGRWLIYSTSPAGSIEGGLTGAAGSTLPRLYNRTFSGSPPGSISEPGNHLIYSSQPTLTVTPDNKTKVYGANDPAQTYVAAGFISDDGVMDNAATAGLTGSFGRITGETVVAPGPAYAITQGTFASNAGYSISFTGGPTLTITPANLTGAIANQSKVYGADDPALGSIGVTLGGVVNRTVATWNGNVVVNDTGNVAATLASLTRDVGETLAGSPYNVTGATFNALTGPAAGNYNAPTFAGSPTLTITPAALSGTIANQTKVYGADDPTLAGIGVSLGGVVNRTVSTWNGNVVVNDAGNVAATLVSLTRDVGESVAGSPYNITGATFNALTGPAAGNYSAPALTGSPTLTINQANLTGSIANQTKMYGAYDPALAGIGVSLGGVVNRTVSTWNGNVVLNDTGNVATTLVSLTRDVGETVAGSPYNITGATFNALTGPAAGNYNASTFAGASTLTVTPAGALTGTISATKAYGQDDPTTAGLPVMLSGQVNRTVATWNGNVVVDDTPAASLATTVATITSRTAGEDVSGSPYTITAATFNALGGASAGNYNGVLNLGGASALAVTPANVTALVTQSKTYGADDLALPLAATSLPGLVNRTVATWNGPVVVNDSALTSNATALTRDVGEGVGVRAITAGTFNAPSANYSAPTLAGGSTLTINAAPLGFALATPGQSKVYAADDPALGGLGVTLAGLVNRTVGTWNGNVGVNDSAVTGTLTSLTRAAGETVAGSPYAITAGTVTLSASDANYAKSFDATNNPTLTITRAPLSVGANAQSKTYGAPDPALTFDAAGLGSATVTDWNGNSTSINDTVSSAFSGALARAPGETVAGSPYAISQGTLAAGRNYNITSFTGNNLTIVPAPLTIAANNASRPVNQPDPPFSATYTGFQLGETPAVLTGALGFNTTAALASPAGLYPIVPFGQSSTSYSITYVNGILTLTGAMPAQPSVNPGNAGSFVAVSILDLATNSVVSGLQQLGGGAVYGGFGQCSSVSIWAPVGCASRTPNRQE